MRKPVCATIAGGDVHLFRIGVNDQIGIMRDQYDLPPWFCGLEIRCEQLVNGLVVKIFVRLIHNKRAGIADVHAKVQDEKYDSLRTGRKLLKLNAVVFQPVTEVQMLHLV